MINVVCLVRVLAMSAHGDEQGTGRRARRAEPRQLNKHSRFAGCSHVQAINVHARTHARRARVEFRSRVNATREIERRARPSDRSCISQRLASEYLMHDLYLQQRRFTGFPAVVVQWHNSSISSRKNNCHASAIIRACDFAICTVMKRFSLSRMIHALPFRFRS